jgi:hypothetical protein
MNPKFDPFTCGEYQGKILNLLNNLKFSDKPEERALLDDWDYGPIQVFGGGHQAVVIYRKGTDWKVDGIVLDPWPLQSPKNGIFPIMAWMPSGITVQESSVYKKYDSAYPMFGNDYQNPRLRVQKKVIKKPKGGAISHCPLNLWIEDAAGRKSGFPDGVPTWEIPEVLFMRIPLVDGTYWTELDYPLDNDYQLIMEGTDSGEADVFLGFNLDTDSQRETYKYSMSVAPGQKYEVSVDARGSPLQSDGSKINPERVQDIDQAWLASKPDIIRPPEHAETSDTGRQREEEYPSPDLGSGGQQIRSYVGSSEAEYQILDHSMGKAIDKERKGNQIADRTDTFSTTDKKMYSWLKFGPTTRSHEVEWIWYSPDGKEFSSGNTATQNPTQDSYSVWWWIPLDWNNGKNTASDLPGNWHVDIFIDGRHVLTENFIIAN